IFDWSSSGHDGPNLILDDGGDATLLVHKGVEFEKAGRVPDPSTGSGTPSTGAGGAANESHEYRVILDLLRASLADDPQRWTRVARDLIGVTEETTTGVHRLYDLAAEGE